MIRMLDKENFAEVTAKGVIMVDFYADWCGPCKALSPIVSALSEDYRDLVVFGKVNVDNSPELARTFGIVGIPTVLVLKDGVLTGKQVGLTNRKKLIQMLEAAL